MSLPFVYSVRKKQPVASSPIRTHLICNTHANPQREKPHHYAKRSHRKPIVNPRVSAVCFQRCVTSFVTGVHIWNTLLCDISISLRHVESCQTLSNSHFYERPRPIPPKLWPSALHGHSLLQIRPWSRHQPPYRLALQR